MTYAIETHALTRTFGDAVAVDRLDLRIPTGSIFGYVGLNGAGKTTTIRMLTTLLEPTGGRARVLGHDVHTAPLAVRRHIGLVGDEAGESRPAWTPREYLGYFARLARLPKRRLRVEEVLDQVGAEAAWRGRAIGVLSTGMKRRVEIARALLSRPRVLFLDEPTRGLDLPAKHAVWALLRRLSHDHGVTVFVSSHEVAEIRALCTQLAVVSRGRLTYNGNIDGLPAAPEAFEARLLSLLDADGVSKPSRPAGR